MTFLPICQYADIGDCRYADIADIFIWSCLPIADRPIFKKKRRYADIADADMNIGTPLETINDLPYYLLRSAVGMTHVLW